MPGIGDKSSPYGFSPNRDPFSFFSFDPVAKKFVERVFEVAGIHEFGVRFPFNRDSATDLTVGSDTTIAVKVSNYRDVLVEAGFTLDFTQSPALIFCREFKVEATAIVHADGINSGGADVAGGAAGNSSDGLPGTVGNDGKNSDRGRTTDASFPQYARGWARGAGGGGGGGGGADASGRDGGAGGNSGKGGRPDGSDEVAAPVRNNGGAGGLNGGASPVAGGSGAAIGVSVFDQIDTLGGLLDFYKTHNGGAGGGAGGGGGGGGEQSGAGTGTGGTSGTGAKGGGILIIVCEKFNNLGIVRAHGEDGVAGSAGSNGVSSGGGGGGGGGGAGGCGGLLLVLTVKSLADGTLTVTGGTGAAGGSGGTAGTGQAGATGGAGDDGGDGEAHVFKANAA